MKQILIAIGAIAIMALAAGCTQPLNAESEPLMSQYNRDTKYKTTPNEGGFELSIYYSRYQFIPESSAVALACRQALMQISHEVAARQGRRLLPINEQRMSVSLGRNGLTGITSCTASVPVEYD
jgi:hypothetical protein